MRFSRCLIVLIVVCAGFRVVAGTQPIVTSDLLRIRSVSAIDVAKDGSRAVFAVRSIATLPPENPNDPNAEPNYKNQSHLFLLDLIAAGMPVRQLTFGERNDSAPRLSPDGKRIAFVREGANKPQNPQGKSPREPEGNAQVWVISIEGGEAQQITSFLGGCHSPIWSPDGQRLLVTASVKLNDLEGTPPWPSERPKRNWKDAANKNVQPRPDGTREQIRAWLERNSSQLNPNTISRIDFHDETSLRGSLRFTHFFLIDPAAPNLPIELNAARRVTSGFYDHAQPAFMPDGQSIVYASKKPQDVHPDRVIPTTLWRINLDGSNDREILNTEGWSLSDPQPSRDGTVIAFQGQRVDEPVFRQTQLGLATITEEGVRNLVWLTEESTFPASVNNVEWLHGQPALAFTAAMRGGTPLLTISPGLIQPAKLVDTQDNLPVGVTSFGTNGGIIVYARTSINNPNVLCVRDGQGDRAVYDLNPWVADKMISIPTAGTVTRPDGTKVQYWLMEPTNREPGKKYPLVTNMHGGPQAMWGPGEFTMWHEFQLMCSWGFGVVYCNPRGSGGYGYEFQRKNFQDWGEGPGGDVLACVDEAIQKEWVDRERLVITGGSYAGYLTAWIIGHDHRYKAAVAQRGVYDFTTFFGEGNAWRLIQYAMGGNPPVMDPKIKQIYDRNNPMNFVTRIKTPLLIKHGSNDLRTGVSQSEMLYRALKDQNKPVEYIRYPDAGHDLSRSGDPLQRMDRLNRIIEFFERYVENPRPAPIASAN